MKDQAGTTKIIRKWAQMTHLASFGLWVSFFFLNFTCIIAYILYYYQKVSKYICFVFFCQQVRVGPGPTLRGPGQGPAKMGWPWPGPVLGQCSRAQHFVHTQIFLSTLTFLSTLPFSIHSALPFLMGWQRAQIDFSKYGNSDECWWILVFFE